MSATSTLVRRSSRFSPKPLDKALQAIIERSPSPREDGDVSQVTMYNLDFINSQALNNPSASPLSLPSSSLLSSPPQAYSYGQRNSFSYQVLPPLPQTYYTSPSPSTLTATDSSEDDDCSSASEAEEEDDVNSDADESHPRSRDSESCEEAPSDDYKTSDESSNQVSPIQQTTDKKGLTLAFKLNIHSISQPDLEFGEGKRLGASVGKSGSTGNLAMSNQILRRQERLRKSARRRKAQLRGERKLPLLLSSEDETVSTQAILNRRVTHILNCGYTQGSSSENPRFKYKHVSMPDATQAHLFRFFEDTTCWMQNAIQGGGTVLVHSFDGISTAASFVMAYLMRFEKLDYKQALFVVSRTRRGLSPNPSSLRQLKMYEDYLNQSKHMAKLMTSNLI